MAPKKLDWQTVPVDKLPAPMAKQYAALQKAREEANEAIAKAQAPLEKAMTEVLQKQGLIPAGTVPVFGFRYPGKIGVAFDVPAGGTKVLDLKF